MTKRPLIIRGRQVTWVVLLFLLYSTAALPDTESDYQKSISKISDQIGDISRDLNRNKALLKTEQDKLFAAETELSALGKSLRQTNEQIDILELDITTLGEKLTAAEESQVKNKESLKSLLKSRYINGEKNHLKLLLNQQNPYAVGRLNNYHDYFSNALRNKFAILRELLAELIVLRNERQSALQILELEQQRQNQQQTKLEETKKRRQQSVARLDTEVNSKAKKLNKLKQDRSRLNELLKQIAKQKAELKRLEEQRQKELAERRAREQSESKPRASPPIIRPPVAGGFIKQKGRLQYPVAGIRKLNYGSRMAESGMTSDGVFFSTNGGDPVKSIFAGRVLFADFLKGYGLLLIIDHGDDHISLYGHNELLYKKVGDMVETNEVVAKTGVTGGLKAPGLYFEIRNKATPVDPADWCQ